MVDNYLLHFWIIFSIKKGEIVKKAIVISLTLISLIISLVFVTASKLVLSTENNHGNNQALPKSVYSYWKNNKAEISSYDLKQVRYGEIREGKAVMIFVTEPFLTNSQVKYDGIKTDETRSEVLKLNFERYFTTGIYPYSMMTSVFTPFNANPDHPYKITTSSQDWCGHTFLQLNNRENNFEINSYSYFQQFGDQNIKLDKAILEDEIWNKIKLDLNSLPIGEIEIIPSTQHLRFAHLEPKAFNAKAELTTQLDNETNSEIYVYRIEYLNLERTFEISFEKELPHKILGWKETYYPLIFDGEKRLMTTEAKLKKTINIDYWNKNSNADSVYRTELGL